MSDDQPPTAATEEAQAAPGWYDTDNGKRYWDGTAWTAHTAASSQAIPLPPPVAGSPTGSINDNDLALFCHLGGAFLSFLVPLIIFLVKKDESPFVRHHAAQALNFQITVAIAFCVSVVLMLILVGFLLFIAVAIASVVFAIMASIDASRGGWYRYPMSLPIFS